MLNIIPIERASGGELEPFARLTDMALRQHVEAHHGLFLAESHKVIERAIDAGLTPHSVLLTEKWLQQLAPLLENFPEVPIYCGSAEQLEAVAGFQMHRGAIAAFHRPQPQDPAALIASASRIVVLDALTDHANVGAVFRSAAALGADAVLLSPECADPLYRRAVRVSMAATLQMPWARLPEWPVAGPLLRDAGFEVVGFALRENAEDLAEFVTRLPRKLALVFGSEGPGLSRKALGASTRLVQIPMDRGIDSLNVATAAALALWAVRSATSAER